MAVPDSLDALRRYERLNVQMAAIGRLNSHLEVARRLDSQAAALNLIGDRRVRQIAEANVARAARVRIAEGVPTDPFGTSKLVGRAMGAVAADPALKLMGRAAGMLGSDPYGTSKLMSRAMGVVTTDFTSKLKGRAAAVTLGSGPYGTSQLVSTAMLEVTAHRSVAVRAFGNARLDELLDAVAGGAVIPWDAPPPAVLKALGIELGEMSAEARAAFLGAYRAVNNRYVALLAMRYGQVGEWLVYIARTACSLIVVLNTPTDSAAAYGCAVAALVLNAGSPPKPKG